MPANIARACQRRVARAENQARVGDYKLLELLINVLKPRAHHIFLHFGANSGLNGKGHRWNN